MTFDPAWGGPTTPVVFAALAPWNNHADEGLRYYSGAAVYRKTFDFSAPATDRAPLFFDLGAVDKQARVKLNGEDLGIVWTPPFRVEVSGDLQPAHKDVRQLCWESGLLLGKPQPAGRFTFTTVKNDYQANSPLQESGLLGPVRLLTLE